ncbi:hypothetical protein C9426_00855 [Serratia sp. S1B]|nr:hypothetical protein C9426_00855 [Serratia sp. S1B]
MTIPIPTDRLHKFLTLGGCALIIWTINISVNNYERTELARAKALIKVQQATWKYNDYASDVNKGIEIYNKAIKNHEDPRKYSKQILENSKKADSKDANAQKALTDVLEAAYTLDTYEKIRNFWFAMSAIFSLLGISAFVIGIYIWYKSS